MHNVLRQIIMRFVNIKLYCIILLIENEQIKEKQSISMLNVDIVHIINFLIEN